MAQPRKPQEKPSIMEEAVDMIVPASTPGFMGRLIMLRLLKFLVDRGLMSQSNSNVIKSGKAYLPKRKLFAGPSSLSNEDELILCRLMDFAFPTGDSQVGKNHRRALVDMARQQGISERVVEDYLRDLLDEETARKIGLLGDNS